VVKTVDSESESLPLRRLVVRVKIPVEAPPAAPVRPSLNRVALLLTGVFIAALLTWLGIRVFTAEPTSAPVAAAAKPIAQPQPPTPLPVPPEAAPAVSDQPPTKPSPAISQVIPDVPRSALNTISGTIRVSIRVIVARDGTVVAATADEPGPSRYFERLAIEAARKWTFGPSDSRNRQVELVRFYFKRGGVTARVAE
jgi:TonB family protein